MPDAELDSLRAILAEASAIAQDPFGAAKAVANICSRLDYDSQSQDLVLRSLDKLQAFGAAKVIINALVRECGLFPYLNLDESSTSDLFAATLDFVTPVWALPLIWCNSWGSLSGGDSK